jgi:hypothetical protein
MQGYTRLVTHLTYNEISIVIRVWYVAPWYSIAKISTRKSISGTIA